MKWREAVGHELRGDSQEHSGEVVEVKAGGKAADNAQEKAEGDAEGEREGGHLLSCNFLIVLSLIHWLRTIPERDKVISDN